ncbi:MAG: gluconate 2-dehydrogenase subunit 3 family protein [Gemmatimonadota bacterium]|nr:gluconate 2-dehydrogenase subunit 3 family protein [Gemmatimonadota bacterium]
MQRRDALRFLAATAALPVLHGLTPHELLALGRKVHELAEASEAIHTLSAHQNRTVVVASERIIPATDTPGASAARVNRFIDAMLTGWYSPDDRDRFLVGLAELDDRSRKAHGVSFVDCTPTQQTALLLALDDKVAALRRAAAMSRSSDTSGPANPDEHWFAMLKYLTIWGYYTSEVAQTRELRLYPLPGRYDGCAPYSR